MSLLIELGVQIARDGTCRLPDWGLSVQCPSCASTDVSADQARLLSGAIGHGAR